MSEAAQQPVESTSKPRGGVSITRILLFGVLIIGVIVLGLDLRARFAADGVHTRLQALLPEDAAGPPSIAGLPTQQEAHEAVGREPDEPAKKHFSGVLREKYTWWGPIRSYFVEASYTGGDDPRLLQVSLNQPVN